MKVFERVAAQLVTANNERVRGADGTTANPRPLAGVSWNDALEGSHRGIQAEWRRFSEGGGQLPHIEDVIAEHQGNEGAWRVGLLVSRGRPRQPLASLFPHTVQALTAVPGLRSALWSVMEPGTNLPTHRGPNAGVLRYHLGVDCGTGATLRVAGDEIPYVDGAGILFDDTVEHSAANLGSRTRVTLFCELLRPLPWRASIPNQMVQAVVSCDRRYRNAPRRAAEWHVALNG